MNNYEYVDRYKPQKILICFFKQKGYNYLDLTQPLKNETKNGEDLHFHFDEHWNTNGHKFVSGIVGSHLNSTLLHHDCMSLKDQN